MARPALQALLAVCLLTTGCSALGPDHTREERAVEVLDNARDSLASTDSYTFESHMTITASDAEGRTEVVTTGLTGAVDTSAQKMRSNGTSGDQSRETFVLNRTVYRECTDRWGGWGVTELEDGSNWTERTPAARQLSLLESGSLYWNGTETVDGNRAVVITGEPTADALTQYQNDQPQPLSGGPNVEDVELRAWLDADTGRPLRTELRFTISQNGNTATATMTTTFDAYGDPVSVELPAEARTNQHELGCPGR